MVIHCQRCTACCRWPGEVVLSGDDIQAIAAFKNISEDELIQTFTRLRRDRRGLALVEQPNGACVFLDGNACAIQPVKPHQCKDFPNGWIKALWGKVPWEQLQKDYPMLFNCAAVKTFLQSEPSQDSKAD
ncbi:MAG: YkgJ family cysteine cluster protein [Verrucomicrobiota bacterium]